MSKQLTTEEFIRRAQEKFGDRFDYSQVVYTKSNEKVKIICPKHGWFRQLPSTHLNQSKHGCDKCGQEATKESQYKRHNPFRRYHKEPKRSNHYGKEKLTTDLFIKKANAIHGGTYTYKNVKYLDTKTKVSVTCKEHGDFLVTPNSHLQKTGCPECFGCGFNKDKPAILYFLELVGGLMKVGVTNKTVETRYQAVDRKHIVRYTTVAFDSGKEAYEAEQKILKNLTLQKHKYKGKPIFKNTGITEMFTTNILSMKELEL